MNIIPNIRLKKGKICKGQVPRTAYQLLLKYKSSTGDLEERGERVIDIVSDDNDGVLADDFRNLLTVVYLLEADRSDDVLTNEKLFAVFNKHFTMNAGTGIQNIEIVKKNIYYFDIERKRYEVSLLADVTI